jgi:LacI family transcriptional regulator
MRRTAGRAGREDNDNVTTNEGSLLEERVTKTTLMDVARAAGVSPMTVSRVLNGRNGASDETKARVLAVVQQLDYRPNAFARGLKSDRSRIVGLIVPDIANPYFPEIIRGAEAIASAEGYSVLLCNVGEDPQREEQILGVLDTQRVEGLICVSARTSDERLLTALRSHRAAVLINRTAPRQIAGTVMVDFAAGSRQGVTHLVRRGRRRFAVLSGPRSSYGGRMRKLGIREALGAAGLEPVDTRPCAPDIDSARDVTLHILRAHADIDAIVCYNDLNAVGAIQACQSAGVAVPGQISVIGFDDIALASLISPKLTTLRVDKYSLGQLSMRMLIDRMNGKHEQHSIVIEPDLIVRESA